ncbi:MAG: hypothetical protein Q7J26_03240 [Brevundimonas sp.]|nr:hypothetical protein [Brevundimonas sp.]MDO9607516.1 hypothetical protein [Brevundimonas sp.]
MQDRITCRVTELLALTGLSRAPLSRLVAPGELPLAKAPERR